MSRTRTKGADFRKVDKIPLYKDDKHPLNAQIVWSQLPGSMRYGEAAISALDVRGIMNQLATLGHLRRASPGYFYLVK